jgi:hypothetical protein
VLPLPPAAWAQTLGPHVCLLHRRKLAGAGVEVGLRWGHPGTPALQGTAGVLFAPHPDLQEPQPQAWLVVSGTIPEALGNPVAAGRGAFLLSSSLLIE